MTLEVRESISTQHGKDAMLPTVRQVLHKKGHGVFTIAPDETVFDALDRMAAYNVGGLVVSESGRVVGIFTERDYARKLALLGHRSKDVKVSEVMSSPVLHVVPSQSVVECMALMTERRVRHLPVIEGERLIGIVSIGDVVKSIISGQAFMIDQLEHYISS